MWYINYTSIKKKVSNGTEPLAEDGGRISLSTRADVEWVSSGQIVVVSQGKLLQRPWALSVYQRQKNKTEVETTSDGNY